MKSLRFISRNINKQVIKMFCSETPKNLTENEALELVESGVFEVLKGAAKCQHEKLSRSAELKDLGFDSLDQVELVVAMEEKFNVNISDEESMKIETVLDAIQTMHKAYIDQHGGKNSSIDIKNDNIPKI